MKTENKEYTITAYTEDYFSLINRINAVFSRRRISIISFHAGPSEMEHIRKFVIIIRETEESVRKITMQIEKQVDVLEVHYHKTPCLSTAQYAR